jgi:hypothetical protein
MFDLPKNMEHLHPAVQVAIVIVTGAVIALFIYAVFIGRRED